MKYVAWVYDLHKYKTVQLSALSSGQLEAFKPIFDQNKSAAVHILKKKLYEILDLDLTFVLKMTTTLHKICSMLRYGISSQIVISVFNRVQSESIKNITTHNIRQIYQFVCMEKDFTQGKIPIQWGPGNHTDQLTNLQAHFVKHVETDPERANWSGILSKPDLESYESYAVNLFYKMRDIIVHSNGRHVYLSGFCQNVFIVGRFDGETFGISSCYYVESGVKRGRESDMCFRLRLKEKN